ncbi:MAG: hypothetical protein HC912_00450 [Saprospiraceae bacterium]|nr:hypothetical protein [Saprospiraceae bacterium]
MLYVSTIGDVNAYWQDQSCLPMRTQKAKALFFYLIIEWTYFGKTEHRREFLADLLWPELDKKAALENLRQTLYIIRSKFKSISQQEFLISHRFSVNKNEELKIGIDLKLLQSTDVFDLIQLPATKHIPLQDLILYDCEPFYDWLINFQAEIQQLSIQKISKTLEYHKALQNWPVVESLTLIYQAQDVIPEPELYYLLASISLKQDKPLQATHWLNLVGLNQLDIENWIRREQETIHHFTNEYKAVRLAVLPFKELHRDESGIALGLVEDMVAYLSKYRELEVVPTFSVIQFQDTDKAMQKIAYELRADYLISGTIRYINTAYKINFHLIDCRKDSVVWSASLNDSEINSNSTQQEITRQLDKALKEKEIIPRDSIQENYLPIPEAYDWYLQAWSIYYKGTPATTQQSIEYFKKSVVIDSAYSRAYLGMVTSICSLASWWGDKKMKDVLEEYKWAQREAAKDPSLHGDLLAINGWARMWLWDLHGAEQDFKEALARKSNVAFCWGGYAHALNMLGKHQEALQIAQQGLYNDSAYIQGCFIFAECNLLLNKLDIAEKICKAALRQQPDLHSGITVLIWVLILREKFSEAIALGEESLTKTQRRTYFVVGRLALAYFNDKQFDKANDLLAEMEKRNAKGEKGFPYFIALFHQVRGNSEKALQVLEKHLEDYSTDYLWLRVQPEFKSLHDNPRFQAILNMVFNQGRKSLVGLL